MEEIKEKIVIELKAVMDEKSLSAGIMARLIGCDVAQIGRWIKGEARPTLVYQRLIRKGIRRAKKL